jgi:hypothetical protein
MSAVVNFEDHSSDITTVKYQAMVMAIRECHQVDEVKMMRDQARALEEYMKQAQNQEAERKACEIRIRAERRAGEILRDMEKAKGQLKQGQELPRSHDATTEKPKTLSDLGINKTQSSRYQALANIPEDIFEQHLADPVSKPSTVGLINRAKELPVPVSIQEQVEPAPQIERHVLRFWGLLREIERDGFLGKPLSHFDGTMTEAMRDDIYRLIPVIRDWFESLCEESDYESA